MDNKEYINIFAKKSRDKIFIQGLLIFSSVLSVYAILKNLSNKKLLNHIGSQNHQIDELKYSAALHQSEAENQAYEKSQVDEQLRNTEAKYTQLQKEHEAVKKS